MLITKQRKSPSELFRYLAEKWPRAFNPSEPKPLKVGIRDDIRAQGCDLSDDELNRALRAYTRISKYLANMRAGAARVDLQGNPTEDVLEADAVAAKTLLRARNSKSESKQSPEQTAEPESSRQAKPQQGLAFKALQTVERQDGVVVVTKRRRQFQKPAS